MSQRSLHVSILVGSDIFVRGLHASLQEVVQSEDAKVEVHSPSRAIHLLENNRLDILILDVEMAPRMVPYLSSEERQPKVILVSEKQHVGHTLPMKEERVCGFFPARAPEWKLKYFFRLALDCDQLQWDPSVCGQCTLRHSLEPRELPLTSREIEIFRLIGLLYSNREIADTLSVSVKTVEAHCCNIKRKLGLDSSRQLLHSAIDWVEGR